MSSDASGWDQEVVRVVRESGGCGQVMFGGTHICIRAAADPHHHGHIACYYCGGPVLGDTGEVHAWSGWVHSACIPEDQ